MTVLPLINNIKHKKLFQIQSYKLHTTKYILILINFLIFLKEREEKKRLFAFNRLKKTKGVGNSFLNNEDVLKCDKD